jgi:hypothetical protein
MSRHYGNVDAIVSPPWSAIRYVVEVKSFEGIVLRNRFLTRPGRYFPLWEPLKQVRNQCARLGRASHFPVLWMPESILDYHYIFQGVLVVNGGVHRLEAALKWFDDGIIRLVVVTFPCVPPESYRNNLKRLSFRYDGEKQQWTGRLNKKDGQSLATQVAKIGGRVEITP